MADRGLTHRDLADRTGISKSTISGVATGARTPPLTAVDQWARILAIPPDELDRWRLLAVAAHAPRDLHDRLVAMADRLARYERGALRPPPGSGDSGPRSPGPVGA